ncbi:MAG: hypothetical protein HQL69_10025 [Magnetococcales bacterium]|nr:hypothetical protein [Magnetococcales bacterium]
MATDTIQNADKKPFTTPKRIIEIFCLLLILVFGWLDRVDQFSSWLLKPEVAFHNQAPLLQGFDGYFYLNLSRDVAKGTYYTEQKKELLKVQHTFPRPEYAPLLPVVIAKLSKLTSYSLIWVAVLLPAFLGPLLAIPLYLLGRYFGGAIMGLSSALLGVFSPYYVLRTSLGWNDTDILNVTLLFLLSFCFLQFTKQKTEQKHVWLVAGLTIYTIFIWWWHTATAQVTVIFLFFVFMAEVYLRQQNKSNWAILAATAIASLLILSYWKGVGFLASIPSNLFDYLMFFFQAKSDTFFPNIALSISELSKPGLSNIVNSTSGGLIFFLISVIGIILLFWLRFRDGALYLLPILGFSMVGVFINGRFLVITAPFLALGLGFALTLIWQRWSLKHFRVLAPIILLIVFAAQYSRFQRISENPIYPHHVKSKAAEGMEKIKEFTPQNSIIWNWWDNGYPLEYWSNRQVIANGNIDKHSGDHITYISLPLATTNQRLAANFMGFYAKHGRQGMNTLFKATNDDIHLGIELVKKICGAGPKQAQKIIEDAKLTPQPGLNSVTDWLEFFFPHDTVKIYLFMRYRLIRVVKWWHKYGNWDVQKNDGPSHLFIHLKGAKKNKHGDLYDEDGELQLSIKDGKITNSLARIVNKLRGNKEKFKKLNFNNTPSLTILEHKASKQFYFMNRSVSQSNAMQLFILNKSDSGYFTQTFNNGLDYQLWEVHPDQIEYLD